MNTKSIKIMNKEKVYKTLLKIGVAVIEFNSIVDDMFKTYNRYLMNL